MGKDTTAFHIKSGRAPYVNFTLPHTRDLHVAYSAKYHAQTPQILNLAGASTPENISEGRGCPASPPKGSGRGH